MSIMSSVKRTYNEAFAEEQKQQKSNKKSVKCQFCNDTFKGQKNLSLHQRRSKQCLKIQYQQKVDNYDEEFDASSWCQSSSSSSPSSEVEEQEVFDAVNYSRHIEARYSKLESLKKCPFTFKYRAGKISMPSECMKFCHLLIPGPVQSSGKQVCYQRIIDEQNVGLFAMWCYDHKRRDLFYDRTGLSLDIAYKKLGLDKVK